MSKKNSIALTLNDEAMASLSDSVKTIFQKSASFVLNDDKEGFIEFCKENFFSSVHYCDYFDDIKEQINDSSSSQANLTKLFLFVSETKKHLFGNFKYDFDFVKPKATSDLLVPVGFNKIDYD